MLSKAWDLIKLAVALLIFGGMFLLYVLAPAWAILGAVALGKGCQ